MCEKKDILQILMSLFQNALNLEDTVPQVTTLDEISSVLSRTNLKTNSVDFALNWLEGFAKLNQASEIEYHPETIRVMSATERTTIPRYCFEFLLERYVEGEITACEREFILHQIMQLKQHNGLPLTYEGFLWIYDMTLANQIYDSETETELFDDQMISFAQH